VVTPGFYLLRPSTRPPTRGPTTCPQTGRGQDGNAGPRKHAYASTRAPAAMLSQAPRSPRCRRGPRTVARHRPRPARSGSSCTSRRRHHPPGACGPTVRQVGRLCAPLVLRQRPTYHPLTKGSTSMATRRGSRMTRKARRRLNGIFLTVIGLSVVVSIIAAATGSHNTGGTPTPQSSSAAASATVAASPSASAAAKTRRHRRHHRHHRPRPKPISATTTAPAAPAAPTGCYPISDEGTCYEPGEYCRDSDHGASGVAGDGEAIVCEDNDGWRWEPA
jgi:hypothetical protein